MLARSTVLKNPATLASSALSFASIGAKDSLHNVRQTGEFAWNLATRPLAEAMNISCAAVPPEVNEFELAKLTPIASRVISVPRVAESPVSFECKVSQIIQLQGADGTKVVKSFYTCRTKTGPAGRCVKKVRGYACNEIRTNSPSEFVGKVTCKNGKRTVALSYRQTV